jgi:amino acid transporter
MSQKIDKHKSKKIDTFFAYRMATSGIGSIAIFIISTIIGTKYNHVIISVIVAFFVNAYILYRLSISGKNRDTE